MFCCSLEKKSCIAFVQTHFVTSTLVSSNITLSSSSQTVEVCFSFSSQSVVLGEWGEYTYSASIVIGCFAALLVILVAICFICGIAN